jgi:hypothetical protein
VTTKLAKAELPEILSRYLAGESMQSIAAEKRVHRRTLYAYLLGNLGGDEYQEKVTEALVARVADSDEELEAARKSKDAVRVAAAREVCRFARMDLERRRPALYGPKQEVTHTQAPVLNIVLLDRPSHEIEVVTPVAALPPAEVVGMEPEGEDGGEEKRQ